MTACTDGDFRDQQGGSSGIYVQYCSEGNWHTLCSGNTGWASPQTLAKVACKQLGYSDQGERTFTNYLTIKQSTNYIGASSRLAHTCPAWLTDIFNIAFTVSQRCNGTETSLAECGIKTLNKCLCGQLAKIECQPAGKKII